MELITGIWTLLAMVDITCATTSPSLSPLTISPTEIFSQGLCDVSSIGGALGEAIRRPAETEVIMSSQGDLASSSDSFMFVFQKTKRITSSSSSGFTLSAYLQNSVGISGSMGCLQIRQGPDHTSSGAVHASVCLRQTPNNLFYQFAFIYRISQNTESSYFLSDLATAPVTLKLTQAASGFLQAIAEYQDPETLEPTTLQIGDLVQFPYFNNAYYGYAVANGGTSQTSGTTSAVFSDDMCIPPTKAPTLSPSVSPRTEAPSISPTNTPTSTSPTTTPTTLGPSLSPSTIHPSTISPTLSPITRGPTLVGAPDVSTTLLDSRDLPRTGLIRVVALGTLNPASPGSIDVLEYSWSGTCNLGGGSVTTSIGADTTSIAVMPETVCPGVSTVTQRVSITITVRVTDSRNSVGAFREGFEVVTVHPPPSNINLQLSPSSGTAYTTKFNLSVSADGIGKLLYSFKANDQILSPYQEGDSIQFVRPAGDFTLSVSVLDEFLGETIYALPSLLLVEDIHGAEENVLLLSSDIIAEDCAALESAVETIRTIYRNFIGVNVAPSETASLVASAQVVFSEAYNNSLFLAEAQYAELLLGVIDSIPQSNTLLSDCDFSQTAVVLLSEESLSDSENATMTTLSNELWNYFAEILEEALTNIPNVNGTSTAFVNQVVGSLINSLAANPNSTQVSQISDVLQTSILYTIPSLLSDTSLGVDATNTVSTLIELGMKAAVQNTTTNTSWKVDCEGVDKALALIDELVQKTGEALTPDEPAFQTNTSAFTTSAKRVFIDDVNFTAEAVTQALLSSSAGILAATTEDGVPRRFAGVLSITTVFRDLQACRPIPDGFDLGAKITSIVLSNSTILEADGSTTTANSNDSLTVIINFPGEKDGCRKAKQEYSCVFWDVNLKEYSSDGCYLDEERASDGSLVCTCSHLTEFAVLRRQNECKDDELGAVYLVGYLVLCGLYATMAIFMIRPIRTALGQGQIGKKRRKSSSGRNRRKQKSQTFDFIKSLCLLLQFLLRIPLCVLFSAVEASFTVNTVDKAVTLFLLALPHTLMWGSYSVMVYQWAVINYHSRINSLATNMFSKYLYHFLLAITFLILIIWTSFALFIYVPSAYWAGPALMSTVTLFFSVYILHQGRGTLAIMTRMKLQSGMKETRQMKSLRFHVHILSVCLIIQCILWTAAAAIALDDQDTFLGLFVMFYAADLFIAWIQIDFLWEFKCIGKAVVLIYSVATFSSDSIFFSSGSRGSRSQRQQSTGTGSHTHGGGSRDTDADVKSSGIDRQRSPSAMMMGGRGVSTGMMSRKVRRGSQAAIILAKRKKSRISSRHLSSEVQPLSRRMSL